MRRFVAGMVVGLLALAVSPADAQTYLPYWSPDTVEVGESSGMVVLTLGKSGPGPVRYRTSDGKCSVYFASQDGATGRPCEPGARAPEDYGAVSGEVIFTEAGSKQITIPIVDDGLDEGHSEAFTVYATEVDERGSWVAGTNIAVVWIIDDDGSDDAGDPSATTATARIGRRFSRASDANPMPRTDGEPGRRSATASAFRTPPEELRPGSGFELTNEAAPEPAPGRGSGGGGSAPWLALGLGAAAVSAGAIVDARRRLRWSPTQV